MTKTRRKLVDEIGPRFYFEFLTINLTVFVKVFFLHFKKRTVTSSTNG